MDHSIRRILIRVLRARIEIGVLEPKIIENNHHAAPNFRRADSGQFAADTMKPLHARGTPSTMVSARRAKSDGHMNANTRNALKPPTNTKPETHKNDNHLDQKCQKGWHCSAPGLTNDVRRIVEAC